MSIKELKEKIEYLQKETYLDDDTEVMILNAKGLYCETDNVDVDGKDRLIIIEKHYERTD